MLTSDMEQASIMYSSIRYRAETGTSTVQLPVMAPYTNNSTTPTHICVGPLFAYAPRGAHAACRARVYTVYMVCAHTIYVYICVPLSYLLGRVPVLVLLMMHDDCCTGAGWRTPC